MHTYTISYAHGSTGGGGRMLRALQNDALAIAYVTHFVSDGYANETGARVDLLDGRTLTCSNRYGRAVNSYEELIPELRDAPVAV